MCSWRPVKLGVIASLARPGDNITGVSFLINELAAKKRPRAASCLVSVIPVSPVQLFGEYGPKGRLVFECDLYGRILCLRRAIFGVGPQSIACARRCE